MNPSPQSSLIPNANGDLNLSDFDKPFYLHHNNTKFYEISLCESCTIIRCGKLLPGNIEDSSTVFDTIQEFDTINEAKSNIQKNITRKRLKGYEFLEDRSKKRKLENNNESNLLTKQIKKDNRSENSAAYNVYIILYIYNIIIL